MTYYDTPNTALMRYERRTHGGLYIFRFEGTPPRWVRERNIHLTLSGGLAFGPLNVLCNPEEGELVLLQTIPGRGGVYITTTEREA